MRTSLLSIAALAVAANAADIVCSAPLATGTLYYTSSNTSTTPVGALGIVEARGNAELLAKYPNTNVASLSLSVIQCNSTYLSASPTPTSIPVLLQLTDGVNCLALESNGAANVFITKQTCQESDDDSQSQQFWTQDSSTGILTPSWEAAESERWNVQFNVDDSIEVLANPAVCFEGQTCQAGTEVGLVVE